MKLTMNKIGLAVALGVFVGVSVSGCGLKEQPAGGGTSRPGQTDKAPVRPPSARLVDIESPRDLPAVDEVRPERCLAVLSGLPAGFIEGPLQGNTTAARMAAFFHAGRSSDIEWAAFDAQEMTLYVIGARGAMEEMADQYPRIIEAVDLKFRTR